MQGLAERHIALGVEVADAVLDGDGQCADEGRELWVRGEGGEQGEVASDRAKGKMSI